MIIIVKFIKYKRGNVVINFMLVTIMSALTIFMCFFKEDSTLVVDGKQIEPVIYQKTFSSTLASADVIAVNLKVFVDNKELNIKSTEENIALMLKAQKITLGTTDIVSPSRETELSAGMKVFITRVKTAAIKQTKPIDFKTIIQKDSKSIKSLTKVAQAGKQGQKSVTSNVTYYNGKEVSRKIISEKVLIAPKNKIIVQGTLPTITFSRGGSSISSKNIINVKATAYCSVSGSSNYTATGIKAVRNPFGYSTIAVDPNKISLGTKLYVEGYGYAIAADKGSAVKGNYIDVYFNTREEALDWGVKHIKVQILD